MKHTLTLSALTFMLISGMALAADDKKEDHQSHAGHGANTPANAPAAIAQLAQKDLTDAEVRTINKDAGKITLKHGEIKNLDMGAMTMVFQVKEPTMLDKVKEGDKVQFTAEKIRGQYVVTSIEKK